MARAYSNKFKLNVVAAPFPLWRQGMAVNQVLSIPGTDLVTATSPGGTLYSVLNAKGLLGGTFGPPSYGPLIYGGGSANRDTSELMIHGGGGASAWAGNDVRGIVLDDDVPRWHFVVQPSAAADIVNAQDRYLDNKPVAAHSYWGNIYSEAVGMFFRFRTWFVWRDDSFSSPLRLSSAPYGGPWDNVQTRNDIALGYYNNAHICVKHPSTGKIWVGGNDGNTGVIREYNPAIDTYGTSYSLSTFNSATGCACIDHTRNIVMYFQWTLQKAFTINLTTGVESEVTLSGPQAAALSGSNTPNYPSGITYDSGIDRVLLYLGGGTDGELYTIQYLSASSWYVDKLPLSVNLNTYFGPQTGIYGRMQYMPRLNGVAICEADTVGHGSQNVVFVRTS